MLTLNMKFQTAVIIFYFCHFSSSHRGPMRQEHKCEVMGSLRQPCPCKDPLEKDSESSNYCSINIGTKLNLYISVDHSVMLPQIVLEEKKNISLFSTLCVLFPKEWLFWFISKFTIQERLWCVLNLLGQWEENHAGGDDERLAETLPSNSSFKNVFSCPAFIPPHMCPLVSNRSL